MRELQRLRGEVPAEPVWAVAWGPWVWPQLVACLLALVWLRVAC